MKPKILERRDPLLYLITNRKSFQHTQNAETVSPLDSSLKAQLAVIELAARSGCSLVQIREKDLCTGDLARFTRKVIGAVRPYGTLVLVNDRFDVALACGADGVHLRTNSIAASVVRRFAQVKGRDELVIGVSTHSIDEAREAESGGADFIVCGPVFPTASKINLGPPLGLTRLVDVCRSVKIPVLALGGVGWQNWQEPLAAGAAGVAGIGLFEPSVELAGNIQQFCRSVRAKLN